MLAKHTLLRASPERPRPGGLGCLNWSQIETYVKEHTEADFSHGICPECGDRMKTDGERTGRLRD